MNGGKEAGWGLFLIIIIIGGIYGGVFTPTEAAAVAAVYSFFIATVRLSRHGPDGRPPGCARRCARHAAHIGFSGHGLCAGVLLRLDDPVLLRHRRLGECHRRGRAWVGLALSLAVLVAYSVWRDPASNPANMPRFIGRRPAGLGPQPRLMGRHFVGTFFHADTRKVMVDSSKTIIMLMFIIVNALLFAHVLTSERIPAGDHRPDGRCYGFTWFTFLIAVNLLLLLGGQFMEPSGLLLIVAPVVFPIAMELGVDPIHLGIIMVVNMEIGMITPPIGLNLFVTSGITGMSLVQVVRAALPFVAVLFVFLIIVTYVPAISTWLPYSLMGPEIVTR
jgi:C4-dicarboxylate transporter DctM subunit